MTDTDQLSVREKISYGFGDFASCIYWATISSYLLIFYTDVFGLSAVAAGTMLGLSRTCDAFFDPVIGMMSDRTRTRWGKFRPYLLWCCVPMAVAAFLTFFVPAFDAKGKLIWAYLTFNAMMILYTTINIPYTALLGVITPNPRERTALSSIKFVGAFAAGILINATLLPMTKVGGWLGAPTVARGWELAFLIYGVVAVISFLIVFFNTKERVTPPKVQEAATGLGSVFNDLGDLVTNAPWLILLATTLTFILFVALRGNVTVHYFKYYIVQQQITLPAWLPAKLAGTQLWGWESLVSVFNTSNQILSLIGAIFVPLFARQVGRRVAFIVLLLVAIGSTAAFYVLKPEQMLLIFLINGLGSLAGGPLSPLLMAMYADTADYAEFKKGRRATGLIFSASIFCQKQGWGWGAGLAAVLLGVMGFVANRPQTLEAQHGLVLLMSVLPAAVGIVSLLIFLAYPLGDKRMAEIGSTLARRRAEEAAESPAS